MLDGGCVYVHVYFIHKLIAYFANTLAPFVKYNFTGIETIVHELNICSQYS